MKISRGFLCASMIFILAFLLFLCYSSISNNYILFYQSNNIVINGLLIRQFISILYFFKDAEYKSIKIL
ncbi:hypothetical protein [Enterocloster phage PMBT24]|uniref:Uncharacterized protein n=1 Tax=Enterocloster phage PMBT24 TaxID=3025413 RepID=A0AAT9TR00_9CAUD|nr:hypothetical protein [Enterocloster phage PMBT24]